MSRSMKNELASKKTKLAGSDRNASDLPVLQSAREGGFYLLDIEKIRPNPDQPRKFFDEKKLEELAASIREKGVLQPILTKPGDDEEFLLVAGERRWRAARMAGLEQIPSMITTGNPDELSLIENIQRDDLKPLEEAEAYARMMDKYGYTQDKIASIVGKAKSTVSEIISLNRLPDEIKEECRNSNDFSRRLLVEIAKQNTPRKMISLFGKAKRNVLNSDDVRSVTRKGAEGQKGRGGGLLRKAERLCQDLDKVALKKMTEEDQKQLLAVLERLKHTIEGMMR